RRFLASVAVLAALPAAAQTPLGATFRVNTSTAEIDHASVASNGTGPFVVAWLGYSFPLGRIAGQRYDADGAPRRGPFYMIDQPQDISSVRQQTTPWVAADSAGDFAVVWAGKILTGTYQVQIRGRRFSGLGAPIGAEFRIDGALTADSANPRVAFDANGGFVVVWDQLPEPYVAYRRYDTSGNPLGPPSNIADGARYSAVAALPGGSFVVSWADTVTTANIWAERFDSTGAPIGGRFLVDGSATSILAAPRVASDPSGAFMIAWESTYPHAMVRKYDASGAAS